MTRHERHRKSNAWTFKLANEWEEERIGRGSAGGHTSIEKHISTEIEIERETHREETSKMQRKEEAGVGWGESVDKPEPTYPPGGEACAENEPDSEQVLAARCQQQPDKQARADRPGCERTESQA